jgi:uncharacterized membrane protein YgaE (UPF0421/DUF939 family)
MNEDRRSALAGLEVAMGSGLGGAMGLVFALLLGLEVPFGLFAGVAIGILIGAVLGAMAPVPRDE